MAPAGDAEVRLAQCVRDGWQGPAGAAQGHQWGFPPWHLDLPHGSLRRWQDHPHGCALRQKDRSAVSSSSSCSCLTWMCCQAARQLCTLIAGTRSSWPHTYLCTHTLSCQRHCISCFRCPCSSGCIFHLHLQAMLNLGGLSLTLLCSCLPALCNVGGLSCTLLWSLWLAPLILGCLSCSFCRWLACSAVCSQLARP